MWLEILSSSGTGLHIQNGSLNHAPLAAGGARLFRPAAGQPLAFIVPRQPGERFAIQPSLYQAPAAAVLLKPQSNTHHFMLHVAERKYVSAPGSPTAEHFDPVFANRQAAKIRECFELSAADPDSISAQCQEFAAAIVRFLAAGQDATALRELLVRQADWYALESIMPLLSQETKDELAKQLIDDPLALTKLRGFNPGDPWAGIAAADLHAWLQGGRDGIFPRHHSIGVEFDFLAERFLPELRRGVRPMNAAEVLVRHRRAAVQPRRRACIMATARNEGIYYLEWLAYHRALGFEEFFIYTNDNDDDSLGLLAALARAGVIHLVESVLAGDTRAQRKAYGHGFAFHPAILDYAWVLVCDLDELLFLDDAYFRSIDAYLAWHERADVDAISVSWRFIKASGQTKWQDLPMMDRLNSPPHSQGLRVKTFVKPRRAAHSYAHFPAEFDGTRLIFRNSVGDIRKYDESERKHGIYGRHVDDEAEFGMCEILHYYYKSAEEYLWKNSRNQGNAAITTNRSVEMMQPHRVQQFFDNFGVLPKPGEPNRVRQLVPGFDRELAYLRSLPGVEAEEARVKETFRVILAKSKAEFRASEVCASMGELGQRFLALLED